MDKLITAKQAAEIISCSHYTVYKYAKKGVLPSRKIQGLRRFRLSDVKRFAEKGF